MTYIEESELKEYEKTILLMIKDVDTDNPLQVTAFANTLIDMGKFILNKTSSRLVKKAYNSEELKKINPLVENKMNPINKELHEIRTVIEHYERVLREDALISVGEMEDDGRPKLSQKDIDKIMAKLNALTEKRDNLLSQDKDYMEVK